MVAGASSGWWAWSPRVRWAYVRGRWVVVRVRKCSVPGCRFDAFQEKAHCLRHRPQTTPPTPRLCQLILW